MVLTVIHNFILELKTPVVHAVVAVEIKYYGVAVDGDCNTKR